MYKSMLETWFPSSDAMPKAFLCDTSEEALLLPDWLKLRMIRSSEPRLVKAGKPRLEPVSALCLVLQLDPLLTELSPPCTVQRSKATVIVSNIFSLGSAV